LSLVIYLDFVYIEAKEREMDETTFTPEFIEATRAMHKRLESPVVGAKVVLSVEYYNGKAYLKAGRVNMASFTLGSHNVAEYLAEAGNHYPSVCSR
jgi:hypothetical protein